MAEAGAHRAVYEGRVNAAMDYVEAHQLTVSKKRDAEKRISEAQKTAATLT